MAAGHLVDQVEAEIRKSGAVVDAHNRGDAVDHLAVSALEEDRAVVGRCFPFVGVAPCQKGGENLQGLCTHGKAEQVDGVAVIPFRIEAWKSASEAAVTIFLRMCFAVVDPAALDVGEQLAGLVPVGPVGRLGGLVGRDAFFPQNLGIVAVVGTAHHVTVLFCQFAVRRVGGQAAHQNHRAFFSRFGRGDGSGASQAC